MSLLAGYASSSEEEEELPRKKQPVVPAIVPKAKPPAAAGGGALFAPLPKPQRRQVNLRNLPLLIEPEGDDDSSSSSSSSWDEEEEDEEQAEQETMAAAATKPAVPTRVQPRMNVDGDDDDDDDHVVPGSSIAPAFESEDTGSGYNSYSTASAPAPPLLQRPSASAPPEDVRPPAKRPRAAEELIRESLARGGHGADDDSDDALAGVTFAAELSTSEIRREAALLQQREGGMLATNLAKSQGITGRRNQQLSQLANVAMKNKHDKEQ